MNLSIAERAKVGQWKFSVSPMPEHLRCDCTECLWKTRVYGGSAYRKRTEIQSVRQLEFIRKHVACYDFIVKLLRIEKKWHIGQFCWNLCLYDECVYDEITISDTFLKNYSIITRISVLIITCYHIYINSKACSLFLSTLRCRRVLFNSLNILILWYIIIVE